MNAELSRGLDSHNAQDHDQQVNRQVGGSETAEDGLSFKPYEMVIISPIFVMILGIPIYMSKRCWENCEHVGWLGLFGLAFCWAIFGLILVYLPQVLYKALANKHYVPLVLFFIVIALGLFFSNLHTV